MGKFLIIDLTPFKISLWTVFVSNGQTQVYQNDHYGFKLKMQEWRKVINKIG